VIGEVLGLRAVLAATCRKSPPWCRRPTRPPQVAMRQRFTIAAAATTANAGQPYGNATPACWQFTDAALIGPWSVDCNAFKGRPQWITIGSQVPPENCE